MYLIIKFIYKVTIVKSPRISGSEPPIGTDLRVFVRKTGSYRAVDRLSGGNNFPTIVFSSSAVALKLHSYDRE